METSQDISDTPKVEEAGGKERRLSRRHECEGFAEGWVSKPGSLFRGEIRDISLTGCFIATKARLNLARYAAVDLRFRLKGQQYRSMARAMDVRQGRGVGLEFLFPNSQPPEWLKNLLQAFSEAAAPPPPPPPKES
jgi:hypothetical protein